MPSKRAVVPDEPKPVVKEKVEPVVAPVVVEPTPAPTPAPKVEKVPEVQRVPVLVNGKLIDFNGEFPLTERGLRSLLLFPENHRIYLVSRGQCRQFHGGEALFPIPDDLAIITRE